jgi:hypothetical protein
MPSPLDDCKKTFKIALLINIFLIKRQALKRWNLTDDWRRYALYIVHGDQERYLGLEEKPLLVFRQWKKLGRKPVFMLRRYISPYARQNLQESASNPPITQQDLPIASLSKEHASKLSEFTVMDMLLSSMARPKNVDRTPAD